VEQPCRPVVPATSAQKPVAATRVAVVLRVGANAVNWQQPCCPTNRTRNGTAVGSVRRAAPVSGRGGVTRHRQGINWHARIARPRQVVGNATKKRLCELKVSPSNRRQVASPAPRRGGGGGVGRGVKNWEQPPLFRQCCGHGYVYRYVRRVGSNQ